MLWLDHLIGYIAINKILQEDNLTDTFRIKSNPPQEQFTDIADCLL